MKKLNLICASIAVLCSVAANAGTLTTATAGGTVFAIENFRGTTSAAANSITPGAVSYSLSTITAVNPGATVFFTVRLAGGLFAAAPLIGTFSFAGAPLVAPAPGAVGGTVTLSTDGTTVQVAVVNQTAGTITLGLGAFNYAPAVGNIASVNSTLSVVGGTVTATVGLTTVAPASLESSAALTTVDLPLPTATIAIAAKAITGTVSSLPGYNGRIDLTASPPASAFTVTAVALGSVTFTNNTGTQNIRAGGADYTLANGNGGANTGAVVTVTQGTGQAFPIGSVLSLNTADTCLLGGVVPLTTGSGTVTFTAATSITAKTLTTTTPVTTGIAWFVCLSAPSAGNTASPIQATLTADVTEGVSTDLIDNATGIGYSLGFNGSQVDVKTFYPASLSIFGYQTFIRIINTGSVAAVVSGAFIPENTGIVGTAFPLTGAIAAGGAVVVTGAQIANVLGNIGSADRPRLRLTAPSNGLVVQYYLQNPGGTITEISSSQ